MRESKMKLIRYSVCFLLIALLCWMFPYTGDDWAWGSQIGIDRLNVWFYNYNGRYVGNLIVLALTRSNLLKTLVMAICLTGIIFLIEYISKKKWSFYVSCIALLMIPKGVLSQAVVWTSGFSNYVVPVFLILIFIAYAYPVFEKEMPKRRKWHCVPFFLLGAMTSLIMENITIYNVILTIGIIVYTIAVHHKVIASHAAWLLGSVAGAVYMFSNKAYHSVVNKESAYQQIGERGIIGNAEKNYVEVIAKYLCLDNVWINLAILIVCFLLFCQCRMLWQRKKELWAARLCLILMTAFNVWAFLSSFGIDIAEKQKRLLYMDGLAVVVYMLGLIVFSILVGIKKNCLWRLLFWNAGIVCLCAPLLVVNPIGPRCFFPIYVLFILLLNELGCQLDGKMIKTILEGKIFQNACICISLVGMAFYLNIFYAIYQVDRDRLVQIRRQEMLGQTSVEVRYLPYGSYLWNDIPEGGWGERFKLFHRLPEYLELKAVYEYSGEKK